jgi:glycosyltransferase involved in cell wall biosynthesis
MKEKIAFVDYSFHKKTRSSDFFKKILLDKFEIDNLWDDHWVGGKAVRVDVLNRYQSIVFWQSISGYADLKKLKSKLIWLPMYDSENVSPYILDSVFYDKLLATLPLRVICFSKKLFNWFSHLGLNCILIRYYPNPKEFPGIKNFENKRIFFWDRGDITFEEVKNIIGSQEIKQLILKIDYDPNRTDRLPSKEEIKKYKIKIIQGHLPKNKYENLLAQTNIFIAPRRREGIGMSFLEAFAQGQCVIANNDSTMNEYIESGVNGLLISDWTKEVDLSQFEKIAKKARNDCFIGYKQWEEDQKIIFEFISLPKTKNKNSVMKIKGLYWSWLVLHTLYWPLLKIYLSFKIKN